MRKCIILILSTMFACSIAATIFAVDRLIEINGIVI